MWDGIKNAFRAALNWIISKWNNLSFRIPGLSLPGVGEVFSGATISTPDIPYLAKGGTITAAGMAVVGENGPELLSMPKGAQVTPLNNAAGGGGPTVIRLEGERAVVEFIRRLIRQNNLLQVT